MGTGGLLLGSYFTNLGGFKNSVDSFIHGAGDDIGGIVDDGTHLIHGATDDAGNLLKDLTDTGGSLLGDVTGLFKDLPYVLTGVVLLGGAYFLYSMSGSSKSGSSSSSVPMGSPVVNVMTTPNATVTT